MRDEVASPITLTREDLYELVWSKPMRELAKDFGISDVALAKRCRRLGIPVPGRGYWARVDAGQQPYRPQLRKREPQSSDAGALAVGPSHEGVVAQGDGMEGSEADTRWIAERDDAWLADRGAYEAEPTNAITVPTSTHKWDPTIRQCRDDLEQAAKKLRASRKAAERAEQWPEWRKRTQTDEEGWAWRSVVDRGQRLWDTHKAVCFRVSLGTYERALSIANALALAAPARGFAVREDEKEGRIVFAGHNAEVQLRLSEQLESKTRPRTGYQGQAEQEKYYLPTGRLRITLEIGYRGSRTFEDRDSCPLESQLNKVLLGIYRLVVKEWQEERRHQAFERKFEEEARQRAEGARIRAERERAEAEARARRRRLVTESSRWAQSKGIRDYVAHIRTAACEGTHENDTLVQWLEWALSVARTLDPTDGRLARSKSDPTEPWQE